MPTSGSVDFSVSRLEIITEALQICEVLGEGNTPNTNQVSDCSRTLNMVTKHLQSKGFNLWTNKQALVFPAANQSKYVLGVGSSDHSCNIDDFVGTTVRIAYAAGLTLEVVSTTGMTTGDFIGVVTDSGTLEWKTLTIVDADTVTLSGALSTTAAIGKQIYTYTTKINRPLRVHSAFQRNMVSTTDTEVIVISKKEYDNMSVKTTDSSNINQVYYDPQLVQGLLFSWPEPSDMTGVLYIRYTRPIEDFDADANTPDFPQEHYLRICWTLARFIMTKYGCASDTKQLILNTYLELTAEDLAFDVEGDTSIFIRPMQG